MKVVRVLIYDGADAWVKTILERSWLYNLPDKKFMQGDHPLIEEKDGTEWEQKIRKKAYSEGYKAGQREAEHWFERKILNLSRGLKRKPLL